MIRRCVFICWLLFRSFLLHSSPTAAQSQKPVSSYGGLHYEMEGLVNTPAVSGYENQARG